MPRITLVGFKNDLPGTVPTIFDVAKHIQETTQLAPKTVVESGHDSEVIDALNSDPRPYFIIANTTEEGAKEENEILTEALKCFGFDIEWAIIQEFFMAPEFERWTGEQ